MNRFRTGADAEVPRVVVVDHYDSYTWNLAHLIAGVTGVLPDVVLHDRTTAEHVLSFDHVVLSAGPGHPDNPADFGVGGEVLRAGSVPVLGICLGMQGLVTTYGGHVEEIPPAHGQVCPVDHQGRGPFDGLPSPLEAVRYHSLAATRVGPDLEVTATCRDPQLGRVVMGVSHRTRPLHGVQFHPESILSEFGRQIVANFLATESLCLL
ncbi:anthranilate synthase component II [Hoyosella altamirensis]|uniref:Anthranilate synthase/aminodeoxychorismate synthase-like glutamine amidotransferase n=1 Tax=Hoyosella altamirensis TaxID=616997 RepID=A0A839RQX4_9ACTN|nr:aminodeoxychorismate/anthranilate synthase component II [Hoyosella altamirensis]MBB3039215.1 anthranilate synthase/aminodeoxychorismate synthase-like glutamine amidotransferase [Hoyosella altamirensis]